MNGTWSQARLCYEASINDDIACAHWCVRYGLLRAMPPCTIHKQDRKIVRRMRGGADHAQLFWRCSKCSDQISVRSGSIFENIKISLGKALMIILCYSQCQDIEETRSALVWSSDAQKPALTTVVRFFNRLRALIDSRVQDRSPIGGPGEIVQIDEALLGRRKYNRGRVVQGTWVLGMIAESGAVRFEVVADRKAKTLLEVITRNVARGSIIHTDQWASYARLETLGYTHGTVNHSERFVSPDGVHTQRIESQWRCIRRRFSKGGIRHKNIQSYLCEYMWRRACRRVHIDCFYALARLVQAE